MALEPITLVALRKWESGYLPQLTPLLTQSFVQWLLSSKHFIGSEVTAA